MIRFPFFIVVLALAALLIHRVAAHASHLPLRTDATATANLNLRSGPGTSYPVLQVMPKGESAYVRTGPHNEHWYEVTYNGMIGYSHGYYLNQSMPSPTPTPAPSSTLWRGDHEEGHMGDWRSPSRVRTEGSNCGGEYNSGGGTSNVSSTYAHTGRYSARLVHTDNSTAAQGVRLFRWCEAQRRSALYYSAWYYIPQHIQSTYWYHIMQWKSAGSHNAKFTLGIANRSDGQMYIELGRGQDSGGGRWTQSLKNLPVGQWIHLEAFVEKATDSTGHVTVWQDGTQIIDVSGVQTANNSDLSWAVISYGEDTFPKNPVIYVDDAAISTSRIGS